MKKRTETFWECGICGGDRLSRKAAAECERKGIVTPRYRFGDIVLVREGRRGNPVPAIVLQIWMDYFHPFYHDGAQGRLPMILLRDKPFQWGNKKKPVRSWQAPSSDDDILGKALKSGRVTRPKPPRNTRDWDEFWKWFGMGDYRRQERVRKWLKDRGIRAKDLVNFNKKWRMPLIPHSR